MGNVVDIESLKGKSLSDVLVVDDSQENQKVSQFTLKHHGFVVHTSGGIRDSKDAIRKLPDKSIILCDLDLSKAPDAEHLTTIGGFIIAAWWFRQREFKHEFILHSTSFNANRYFHRVLTWPMRTYFSRRGIYSQPKKVLMDPMRAFYKENH